MFYKIVRSGKSESYPFDSSASYISDNGKDWIFAGGLQMPKELVDEAYSCKIHSGESKEFVMETGGLTWQDIKCIIEIADKILDCQPMGFLATEEAYYTEILRRYKEEKEG